MTTEKVKRPLADVRGTAEALAEILGPACKQLAIAGSIRRQKPFVGDIELLAIPKEEKEKRAVPGDLFGHKELVEVNRLWDMLDGFEASQKLLYIKRGPKYRSFRWRLLGKADDWVQVDLFTAVRETWGNQLMIRTGSAEFSHLMMARLNARGMTSLAGRIFHVIDGKPSGSPVPTPTEADVFKLAGMQYVEPQFREAEDRNTILREHSR